MLNHVKCAAALKALNEAGRTQGTQAAIAYLISQYPDIRDVLEAQQDFMLKCLGDPRDEASFGYAERINVAAGELQDKADRESTDETTLNGVYYDYRVRA